MLPMPTLLNDANRLRTVVSMMTIALGRLIRSSRGEEGLWRKNVLEYYAFINAAQESSGALCDPQIA